MARQTDDESATETEQDVLVACDRCGALVVDEAKHEAWHAGQDVHDHPHVLTVAAR
jgi:hypothetical protein